MAGGLPDPPLFCPTDCDSSVASHFSSSPAVMFPASPNSRRMVSASSAWWSGMGRLPGVDRLRLRYRRRVPEKQTDAERSAQDRGESPDEVLDRNVNEVLQEIRVAITAVQVLFAFLLTLPFQSRFADLGTFGTTVYSVTMISTALATVVLIAPVSFHRMLFRRRQKEEIVQFADRCLVVGLTLLLTGITSAVLLVLDVVLGRWPAIGVCTAIVAIGLTTWYLLPLRQRADRPS